MTGGYMPKLILHDAYHFLTCSTFERWPYLKSGECKNILYQQILKASQKFNLNVLAYAILDDHYHLLFYLRNGLCRKKVVGQINGASSFFINKIMRRNGRVWGNHWFRYGSSVQSVRLMAGYVAGNPLKHGLVKSFQELRNYRFSSYVAIVKRYGAESAELLVSDVINLPLEIPR